MKRLIAWCRNTWEEAQALRKTAMLSPPIDTNGAEVTPGELIRRIPFAHATHQGEDYRNHRFEDLNANQAKFVSCDFSYSIFDRGYFHGAVFESCKFTGCRFYDSNLRGASFCICDLRYATFHRTLLEPEEVLVTLPLEPNLRRDSLQNLRANAVEIGDFLSQRTYVLEEIKAKADHLSRALRGSDGYYRRKYGTLAAKAKAGFSLIALKIGGFIWGHGERPGHILLAPWITSLMRRLENRDGHVEAANEI